MLAVVTEQAQENLDIETRDTHSTFDTLLTLAMGLVRVGRYHEAKTFLRHSLAGFEGLLGKDYVHTSISSIT